MTGRYFGFLVAFSASVAPATMLKSKPIEPGNYCAKEPVVADFGDGRTSPLGDLLMYMTIDKGAQGYSVGFWNVMPDNPQMLRGESQEVSVQPNGDLAFSFVDGWENEGNARITPNGHVTLEVVKYAPNNQIGRNYGDYQLDRETCLEKEFTGEIQR